MLPGVHFRAFVLEELTARGIRCLTLRQRGRSELARLVALTVAAWREITPAPKTPSRNGCYLRFHVPSR